MGFWPWFFNFSICSSIFSSSIFWKRILGSFIIWFSSINSSLPAWSHLGRLIFNSSANSKAFFGIKGSKTIAKLAVICNDIFIIVFTLSGFVFINFQGSVSAKYLFPALANFIASPCASLNLKERTACAILSGVSLIVFSNSTSTSKRLFLDGTLPL